MLRKMPAVIVVALIAASALAAGADLPKDVRERALKVAAKLEKLEREAARKPSSPPPSAEVSEPDLNAWIAWRVSVEMGKFVKSIELRLLDRDRVEGKIALDTAGSPASLLIPAGADFFFAASGESREGKIRIKIDTLYLGSQRLAPAVIDTIISVGASMQGQKATSLDDWYPLPYGIKRLESRRGRLVCHYR